MSLYVRLFCRGSVIAKIIGNNVLGKPDAFVERVLMYVYEEIVDGMKLTDIINTQHENTKYLPGCILPDNVVSMVSVLCKKLNEGFLISGLNMQCLSYFQIFCYYILSHHS